MISTRSIYQKQKNLLLSLENATFQQLPQLIDLLAKVLKKLIANLTITTNSAFSIAKTSIPDIFNGIDPEKLNNFLF